MFQKKDKGITHTIDVGAQIFVVEFSPFEWSKNLILLGLASKIVIASIIFPEEKDDEGDEEDSSINTDNYDISFKILKELYVELRVQTLTWGPDTSLKGLPRIVSFAAANSDHDIAIYTGDLGEDCQWRVLNGHRDYVNAIAFDPEGSVLASVSDDLTCQLWNLREEYGKTLDNKSDVTFWLSSPGMSVCWHPAEPNKLLVGEKSGLLQLFNVGSQQPILSLDAGQVPLMAAHWAPSNSMCVAAIAGGELMTWDISRPSRATEVRPVHAQGGRWLKFCSNSELVVATLGRPGHELKVCNIRAKLPSLSVTLPLASGLSWHQHLPYVVVGCDTKLCFWKVATK